MKMDKNTGMPLYSLTTGERDINGEGYSTGSSTTCGFDL